MCSADKKFPVLHPYISDKIMEANNPNTCLSINGSSSCNPNPTVSERRAGPNILVLNCIFVGGFKDKAKEDDLWNIFSQYGAISEVKIITDVKGTPKGYGFVTFQFQEDVIKVLSCVHNIFLKGSLLRIAQAVRKPRHSRYFLGPSITSRPRQIPQASGTGYSYPSAPAQVWTHPTALMLPPSNQLVYEPPADHYYQMAPPTFQSIYPCQFESPYEAAGGVPAHHMELTSPEYWVLPSYFLRRPQYDRYISDIIRQPGQLLGFLGHAPHPQLPRRPHSYT